MNPTKPLRRFTRLHAKPRRLALLALVLCVLLSLGLWAVTDLHHGHYLSGMNNRIVWGVPHVFSIFCIVAASGALNVASLATVFARTEFQPYTRLAAALAITLLCAGLMILVLDLGRPDRFLLAFLRFNTLSVFSWNTLLYSGFTVLVVAYLLAQFQAAWSGKVRALGYIAFFGRLMLTVGTGCIFAVVVARDAYGSILLVPLMIAASFLFGHAVFMLSVALLNRLGCPLAGPVQFQSWARWLVAYLCVFFFFQALWHASSWWLQEATAYQVFLLSGESLYSKILWFGQIAGGFILPLLLVLCSKVSVQRAVFAAALAAVGGVCFFYVFIISGQAFPLPLLEGFSITSSLADGQIVPYFATWQEWFFSLGALAAAAGFLLLALQVLPFLPDQTNPL